MLGLGVQELLVILCILLVLFGASRLPELGSSLGRAIRELGKAVKQLSGPDVAPAEKEGGRGAK